MSPVKNINAKLSLFDNNQGPLVKKALKNQYNSLFQAFRLMSKGFFVFGTTNALFEQNKMILR